MEGEEGPVAEMEALVRRLRLHRPAPSPYEPSEAVAPAPGADAGELFRLRRAAVLVCLFRGAAGELRVILTKRSSSLSTHSGEVALPSVKAEEGDADDAATALRESKEEIGLDPALVTIVTYLEHFLSKVQFLPFSVKAQWNIFSQFTCRCINVIAAFPRPRTVREAYGTGYALFFITFLFLIFHLSSCHVVL